jgi:diguanylate cyclase (GGDEF)-like protein
VKKDKSSSARKHAAGQPLEAGKNAPAPPEAAVKPLAKREAALIAGEKALLSREKGAGLREEGASLREKGAGLREEALGRQESGADLAEAKAILSREAGVRLREEGAGRREEGASLREEGAGLREEGAGLREEGAGLREEGAGLREKAAGTQGGGAAGMLEKAILNREVGAELREKGAVRREKGAGQREKGAKLREEGLSLREEGADLREKALGDARTKGISTDTEAQLREANESLVIATVQAMTMTEAAGKLSDQMAYMAEHDFLTGLPNRALLTDRLVQSIALAERHGKKVALLFVDLDHFKQVNDSLGHAVGDQLLQSVAKRMEACIRHSDTVSRSGGDEFVVLLTEVEEMRDATLIAEKMIRAMTKPYRIDGHRLHVTLSIGISLFPDDGKDVETVLSNADTAMYHAKNSGRNKYQVFTAAMKTSAVALHAVEQGLHHALEQSEFVLHYQPEVNLETGAVTGAEALLRWQRPNHQLDYPAQFLSIAENCGLIVPIGKWVLREACRQAREWLQAGLDLDHIAVNVSAVELHGKDFLNAVLATLTESGLNPQFLELELNENGLMQDAQKTTAILRALRDIGVRIAIHNFGTGYSSLGYLQRFPVDALKIDHSFVQGIESVGDSIVSTIIGMGANLKIRVVAEGVETRGQFDFLQSHHCAEGQGYYLGQPVAAGEFATLLATRRH